ncbi:MAG: hypothetical protein LBK99_12395 [Opitutaceae bacterium]|jgi:hypothetical protein|nr:hypothetical protein [Opitutaceae bacterium]
MKAYMIHPASPAFVSNTRRTLGVLALASSLLFPAGLQASTTPIVSTTFTTGSSFDNAGWTASYGTAGAAAVWEIKTITQLGTAAAVFVQSTSASPNSPKTSASLVKTFAAVDFTGQTLSLTFNAGWLYGNTNYTASGFHVALLDDDGNGYVFSNRRSTGNTYSAGWAKVTDGNLNPTLTGVATTFDTSQVNIAQNGSAGFPTFSITRSTLGQWSFSATQWPEALAFSDTTFSTFTRIVFSTEAHFDNSISLLLNNVTLTATATGASIPEPRTTALIGGLAGLVLAVCHLHWRRRR